MYNHQEHQAHHIRLLNQFQCLVLVLVVAPPLESHTNSNGIGTRFFLLIDRDQREVSVIEDLEVVDEVNGLSTTQHSRKRVVLLVLESARHALWQERLEKFV
jgi:hypothetical protein